MQTVVQSLKQQGETLRTALKVLETLTYSCTDTDVLQELTTKVEELITDFKTKIPQDNGLILRPEARKAAQKMAQKISRKYKALPTMTRRGRHKMDWKYRNRVGQKADKLRKVSIT